MGLAFWGGFASGMSKSIERNRDRKQKQDKVKADNLERQNANAKADKASVAKLRETSGNDMYKLQSDKQKIMSEDYSGTGESRIRATNAVNSRMQDVARSANDRAVELGEAPLINIADYDTTPQATKFIDDVEYLVPKDLAARVDEAGDEMKFVGNEVHQAVYEQNSQGQMILKKDKDGNIEYEDSGMKLQKYDDVFKKQKSKDGSIGDAQYLEYSRKETEAGREPLTKAGYTAKEKASATSSPLKASFRYASELKSGKVEFDENTAFDHEADVIASKTMKEVTAKKISEFKDSADLETGYDELNAEWQTAIDSGLYESGIISTLQQGVSEFIGMDKADIAGLTAEQVAERLNIDTKLGDDVARYVKLISGAAATDAERANLMNIMFGSDFKSQDVRIAKFKAFIQKRKASNQRTAKQIMSVAPHTGGSYLYKDQIAARKKETESDIVVEKTRESRAKEIRAGNKDVTQAQLDEYFKSIGI